MSNIDKQALVIPQREKHDWSQAVMRDCDFCQQWALAVWHSDGGGICASCCDSEYTTALSSALVVALDELEAKDAQIASLTAERDALREGEMGDAKHSNTRAAADIYFQLVQECEVPAGGSLVEYVSELRERAAMFHGADGNSPVIPDGWVPCSERMPSVGEKVLAYRPDAPESNDPLIKMAKYVGKSAHGHGFDCYCKPSHWMLLPSAPQQEA
jgi:hypothetical protein